MQPIRPYDNRGYNWGSDTEDEMPPSEYIDDEVISQRVMTSSGILLWNGPYTSNPPMGPIEADQYIDSLRHNTQVARESLPSEPTPAPSSPRFPRAAHGRPAHMWMHHPEVKYCYISIICLLIYIIYIYLG